MSRRALLALLLPLALAGADAAPPHPAPAPGIDATTARRAEELAAAYERERAEATASVDPAALAKLEEVELALLEAEESLKRGANEAATRPFLAAADGLRAVYAGERAGLAKRLRAADARLTALARALLTAPDVLPASDAGVPAEVPEAQRRSDPEPVEASPPAEAAPSDR